MTLSNKYPLPEHYKTKMLEIIQLHLPTAKIYLYGSRARNENRKGSDIDIALDTGNVIDIKIMWKIEEAIEDSTIPFFVDVIDLNNISSKFRERIEKDMVPWKV